MKVLVDSSVWIEYFRSRPLISEDSLSFLDLLIADDRACTIWPIQAELLCGRLSPEEVTPINEAFEAMEHIDLDWNHSLIWDRIIALAGIVHKRSLPLPGIVDRMILSAAEKRGASLWTLDGSMKKLAGAVGIQLF